MDPSADRAPCRVLLGASKETTGPDRALSLRVVATERVAHEPAARGGTLRLPAGHATLRGEWCDQFVG
jgi:hypothetical protein